MKLSIFSFFLFAFVMFTSCDKEKTNADAELIAAIQAATDKQEINAADLPISSQQLLDSDYSESFSENNRLAPELGYEIILRRGEGTRAGEKNEVYFDLDGRKLLSDREQKIDCRKEDCTEYGKDRKECFRLVYPVTFVMSDDSELTVANEEEMWTEMKEWYANNSDLKEKPVFQYPVSIIYEEGISKVIETEEAMEEAYKACKNDKWEDKEMCFRLVYPVDFTMPDGSIFTLDIVDGKENWDDMKDWYEANPLSKDKPELVYPVDIQLEATTTETVNNEAEMIEWKESCE